MTTPYIGYSSSYATDDTTVALGEDFSKIILVSTSDDADASVFPVNVPIRFTSNDASFLAKLGTGDLAAALTGINDQLGGDGADVCIVRVAAGTDANPANALAQTQANIVGDAGLKSGLWAARNAPQVVKAAFHLWYAGHTAEAGSNGADNPVRAALAPLLEAAKAISIVDVDPTSKIAAISARELMSSKRMMPLGVAAKVYETVSGAATLVQRPMSPRILGLIVAVDNAYRKGMPFDSFCNRAILGLADINRPIGFDLGDGSTEAQLMLASDVAVVVKGETADAGAIADGGFVFLGVESAANDPTWSQIHQVRGADYIDVEMAQVTRKYLGGRITPRRVEAWLTSLDDLLRDHSNNADILGFERDFPAAINSVSDVRQGTLSIQTHVEPAPVFRRAYNEFRRYPDAVQALVDSIVATAGSQSGFAS